MLFLLSLILVFSPIHSLQCYTNNDIPINDFSSEDSDTENCPANIDLCYIQVPKHDIEKIERQGCDTSNQCTPELTNKCAKTYINGEYKLFCCCDDDLCNTDDFVEEEVYNWELHEFRWLGHVFKILFYIATYIISCFLFYVVLKKVKIVKQNIKPCKAFIPFLNQFMWVTTVAELKPEWFCISLVGMFCGCWLCIEPYIAIKVGNRFNKSKCWSFCCLFCCRLCGLFSLALDQEAQYTSGIALRVRDQDSDNENPNYNNGQGANNDNVNDNDSEGEKETYVASQVNVNLISHDANNNNNNIRYQPPRLPIPEGPVVVQNDVVVSTYCTGDNQDADMPLMTDV